MKWAFWIAIATIGYTYLGYPLLLWLRSVLGRRPVKKETAEPTVSVVIAAHNEIRNLPAKLQNLRALDYDQNKLEIVISSDGSNDGTNEWLASVAGQLRYVVSPEKHGKTVALNRALEICTGEIVVFTDARQELEPNAVRNLVASFADESVGCVSGELMLRDATGTPSGLGIYWKFEKLIRKLESATGSVMGATGALYAVRRTLVPIFPAGLVLDDVYCPVQVIRACKRVLFEPTAVAWDSVASASSVEFNRKVRTLAGNYQILSLLPELLLPGRGFGIRFISHKLLRLVVPWMFLLALVASILLAADTFYLAAALLQAAFYFAGFSGIALKSDWKPLKIAATIVGLNLAAALALVRFARHHRDLAGLWTPTSSHLAANAASGSVRQ